MRLSEVKHQERALSILRRGLRSGRTHHAYLFDGPEGVGKELTARALAARLLCHDQARGPDDDACGNCLSCRLFAAGSHPDYDLIHRGLYKLHPDRTVRAKTAIYLSVELIRHFLIDAANLAPSQGERRVFVIRDAERMNEAAQNALLKTLEEPSGQVVMILVTASATRLLPTIRSRCQRVPFDLLPPAFVADELTSRADLAPADARALAALADGRLGLALYYHEVGLLDRLEPLAEALDALAAGDADTFGKLFDTETKALAEVLLELEAAELAELIETEPETSPSSKGGDPDRDLAPAAKRDAAKLLLQLIAAHYRDALLLQNGAERLTTLAARRAWVEKLSESLPGSRVDDCLQAISTAERMIDRNVQVELAVNRLGAALLGEVAPA